MSAFKCHGQASRGQKWPSHEGRARRRAHAPERMRVAFARLLVFRRLAAQRITVRRRLAVLLAAAFLFGAALLFPAAWLVHYVYFDRTNLPDLEPFVRFEPPTTGVVRDVHGTVLIELAREYRRIVTYDEVPPILRQAILAAEDKRFYTHSGVEYRALPRVVQKTAKRSLAEWWKGHDGFRLLLPQGGSTITQQLVRCYFLQEMTGRTDRDARSNSGLGAPRLLSWVIGSSATDKLLRKAEEVRLALWLEEQMRRRYGSQEKAKREIFTRYASFIYLGKGRYGFAAASEYYFGKTLSSYTSDDADTAALLAAIGKSPKVYAPEPGNRRVLVRRNRILALMARNGYITEDLATRCRNRPIRIAPHGAIKTNAPAAIEQVLDDLAKRGGSRCRVEDLFQGRISVTSTVDARVQAIVNEALEHGLTLYEKRHPKGKGVVQGSVVVLRNVDAAILAVAGGRRVYRDCDASYSDFNRATASLRQPGSAMKPLVYLAAFKSGMGLDTPVPDEPISVPLGDAGDIKWIANYDRQFKGTIPLRQALAESRNAVAVWVAREIGVDTVIETASELGIRTPLQPYLSTALGASEVRLVELADAYRAIASGVVAEPHVIARVTGASDDVLYEPSRETRAIHSEALRSIQEGLRGVIRLPDGTAHSLDRPDFPIPVMGKTGTTSDCRDALFVGSTYGIAGITVAVRIGFDDNRPLGSRETGSRTALPVFREILLRVYRDQLVGVAPPFPREIEDSIDQYLSAQVTPAAAPAGPLESGQDETPAGNFVTGPADPL